MASTYDVVIVGGGIAGLSLASALAGKCSVALVEAEQQLAYHTSSRSARQLIPSYGPPVVQELTVRTLGLIAADDAGRPRPVLTPRSFLLIGDEETVQAEASGEMRLISHGEALGLCPALKPESSSAAGLDTGSFGCDAPVLLERHRARAEAAGVDIVTGARVHSAQRLGSGWEIGAGQEGFSAGVLVNAAGAWADELAVLSGVEKIGLQPYRRTAAIVGVGHPLPEGSPMVAAADDSFYFRREGGDVLISPSEHVARPGGGRTSPSRGRGAAHLPAQYADDPGDRPRPDRLDRPAHRGGRRRPGSGVRRRGPRILLARRPGRLRVPDVVRYRGTGRCPDPGGSGSGSGCQCRTGNQCRSGTQCHAGYGRGSGIPDGGCPGCDALVHPALKNGSMSTLITNIAELMTQDAEHRVLKNAAVVIEGERISWIGQASAAPAADDAVDAGERAVLPGWVDSHTHLIFAGDRTAEFEARMAGEEYSAGGIAVTTEATRNTGDYDLTRLAQGRVAEAVSQGTTYLETKTGYGLDVEQEARSARIASTVAGRGHLPGRPPGAGRDGCG
jgi:glycine/D-amino acid oxidase-like deaminating enzyme